MSRGHFYFAARRPQERWRRCVGVIMLEGERHVPKYVIERNIPGAGELTDAQFQEISKKSCGVIRNIGPGIQWLHSYVTGDKIYCVYIADSEETIREHARQGGFPADSVAQVRRMIDPTCADRSSGA